MTGGSDWITLSREEDSLVLSLSGDWLIGNARVIDRDLRAVAAGGARSAVIDLEALSALDTSGAWLIERLRRSLQSDDIPTSLRGTQPTHGPLLARMETLAGQPVPDPERVSALWAVAERTGRATMEVLAEAADLLNFLGLATVTALRSIARPGRIRFTAMVNHLETTGFNALPIVGLLSFLIGVVLAYQGADQLRRFGAEIFTVNLIGISILREMGILMTAIIIAGRSGSAFTAQIGTMQVNEEVDAMRTIGLDPIEVLVLPRAMALLIALPLLTVYANIMGLLGGAVMTHYVLDISLLQYAERLREVVPIWAFWVGLIKAPVFGFVIALVGCREGLRVRGSADSVGRQTTRSVVVSIFLVIVLDALFSIFFSLVGV